jgi:DNA processing protein
MAELVPFPGGGLHSPEHAGDDRGGSSRASSEQTRVLDALSQRAARTTSEVAERSGLSISSVQSILGVLELDSTVAEREKGWVRRGG